MDEMVGKAAAAHFKRQAEKQLEKGAAQIKGRPSVMRSDEAKTEREKRLKYDMEVRPIQLWCEKLENMLVILEAEEKFSKSLFFLLGIKLIICVFSAKTLG